MSETKHTRKQWLLTTSAVFVALCLFGALAWSIYEAKARAEAQAARERMAAMAERVEAARAVAAADERAREAAAVKAAAAAEIEKQKRLEEQAEINTANSDMKAILDAIEAFVDINGQLPQRDRWKKALKAQELIAERESTPAEKEQMSSKPKLKLTDPWGKPYHLRYPDSAGADSCCEITSFGPDKTKGTGDDIWKYRFLTVKRGNQGVQP